MPDAPHTPDRVAYHAAWSWLMRLHALSTGSSTADEAEMRVNMVAPLICMRFPREAFCQRSLEHVAAASRFWPAYGELVARLGEWWRGHRPFVSALPAPRIPDRVAPTAEELAYVRERVVTVVAEAAKRERRDEARRRRSPVSLPDVSLKGEALARVRAGRRVG